MTSESITTCPLCDSPTPQHTRLSPNDIYDFKCPICGRVKITIEAVIGAPDVFLGSRHLLSGVCRLAHTRGLEPPLIGTDNVEDILDSAAIPQTVIQRSDCILSFLKHQSQYVGHAIPLVLETNISIAFAKNFSEFRTFCDYLKSQSLITIWGDRKLASLTPQGWMRLDVQQNQSRPSDQGFVAMWFDQTMTPAFRKGIFQAIKDSGYKPLRVDLIQHNQKIDDRIIAEIRKSAFLVADLTGHRGGVYFEAGFALGLGIPVIWTCREDHIHEVHFDTRQYYYILWKTPKELYQKLKDRIEATIPSPPKHAGAA